MHRINNTIEKIVQWHHARNLVQGATHANQFLKLVEEVGELAGNLARGRDIRDDVGDIMVVLINLCEREGITLEECLEEAWEDIKDRKGQMVNGVYVKEEDIKPPLGAASELKKKKGLVTVGSLPVGSIFVEDADEVTKYMVLEHFPTSVSTACLNTEETCLLNKTTLVIHN